MRPLCLVLLQTLLNYTQHKWMPAAYRHIKYMNTHACRAYYTRQCSIIIVGRQCSDCVQQLLDVFVKQFYIMMIFW